MKYVHFFLLSTLFIIHVHGQTTTPPQIIPPAPEAASVFKFSEVPVSTYTGLPDISVPIYEIKTKHMVIPINLSYQARGIMVEEVAPRVGLGWSLNYGGMVSRQTRDKADDLANGYLVQNYYNGVFTDATQRGAMWEAYSSGSPDIVPDMVPDQFFFQANTVNGKFVFNQATQGILQQKYSDVKISKTWSQDQTGIESWIVTDEHGNKFYYGKSKDGSRAALDYDETVSYVYSSPSETVTTMNGGNDRAVTTWHLMEIETPFHESISFWYEEELSTYYRRSFDDVKQGTISSHFALVHSHQQQIKEIAFDNGKVIFSEAATEREDLEDGYVLDKIDILDDKGISLKEYQFAYQYTISPDDNNQLPYLKTADPKSSKRLFLSSMQEKGTLGTSAPPYAFEYYPRLLPNRFSNSQDSWGYYNAADNGRYLTFFNYGTGNVNREVNEDACMAGILTKITYPMGGSVEFTYEQNEAVPPAFMGELLTTLTPQPTVVSKVAGFFKNPRYLTGDSTYEKTITIGTAIQGGVDFEFNLPFCPTGQQPMDPECLYRVSLKDAQGIETFLYSYSNDIRKKNIDIDPGTYTLKVYPDNLNPSAASLFNVALSWNEELTGQDIDTVTIQASGKRVRRIVYKTGDDTAFTREYGYIGPNGPSGVIFGLPNFYQCQSIANATVVDAYGSMPGSPLSTYQGNTVGYSFVSEYYGTPDNNQGKIEYEFTVTQDGGDYYKFPYHLPIDCEWLRGKNTYTRYYEKTPSGDYDLKKSVENKYLYAGLSKEVFSTPFLPADYVYKDSVSRTQFYLPLLIFDSDASFKVYALTGGTFDMLSTSEIYYGQAVLANTVNYHYDYDRHYQLRAHDHTRSNGDQEISVATYAGDYPQGTPFIDSMVVNNMLSYPVEEVTYKQGEDNSYQVLSGKITKYNDEKPAQIDKIFTVQNTDPIPLQQFKFSHRQIGEIPLTGHASAYAPDTSYRLALTYDAYDGKGNLLQFSKTGDAKTSYLWDYNGKYPIAEAINASQPDIAYTSFESDGSGNWQVTSAHRDSVAKTGDKSYALANGAISKSGLNAGSIYRVSFWGASGAYVTVNGKVPVMGNTLNGWTYYEILVSNAVVVTVSGAGTIDELRLCPANALMKTYSYDVVYGLKSSTDENNQTVYYNYDGLGRLSDIRDNGNNVLKTFRYNYYMGKSID